VMQRRRGNSCAGSSGGPLWKRRSAFPRPNLRRSSRRSGRRSSLQGASTEGRPNSAKMQRAVPWSRSLGLRESMSRVGHRSGHTARGQRAGIAPFLRTELDHPSSWPLRRPASGFRRRWGVGSAAPCSFTRFGVFIDQCRSALIAPTAVSLSRRAAFASSAYSRTTTTSTTKQPLGVPTS